MLKCHMPSPGLRWQKLNLSLSLFLSLSCSQMLKIKKGRSLLKILPSSPGRDRSIHVLCSPEILISVILCSTDQSENIRCYSGLPLYGYVYTSELIHFSAELEDVMAQQMHFSPPKLDGAPCAFSQQFLAIHTGSNLTGRYGLSILDSRGTTGHRTPHSPSHSPLILLISGSSKRSQK